MSVNGINPAQYRAAWQRSRAASSGNSAFGDLLSAASATQGGVDTYLPSEAASALRSATQESFQLPNGLWSTADGTTSNGKFTFTLSASADLNKRFTAWKAGRTPVEMPDAGGLTEKNLEYLRQRYTGSLSEFERMEVFQALRDIGVLSLRNYNRAMGYGEIRSASLDKSCSGDAQEYAGGLSGVSQSSIDLAESRWTADWYKQWQAIHVDSPFAKCEDLSDILAWVADLTEK